MKKRTIKRGGVLLAALLFSLSVTGCGQSTATEQNDWRKTTFASGTQALYTAEESSDGWDGEWEVTLDETPDPGSGYTYTDDEIRPDTARKLITTVRMSTETDDITTFHQHILQQVSAFGGYVESASVYNGRSSDEGTNNQNPRSADYTLRIPSDQLDAFLSAIGDASNVLEHSRYVEDITLQYVDTRSRKEVLLTEQARLMEWLESAENMEELLAIEDRLTMVRYEIERIESTLRTYDNQTDYSTVHLGAQEVITYTPAQKPGMLQRMKDGFSANLRGMGNFFTNVCVLIVSYLPQIALCAIPLIVLAVFLKKHLRKKNTQEVPSV